MAPLETEAKIGGEKEVIDSGERAESAAPSRVLTNVFVPTRTQLFTIPPEGPILTRRRFVIDETWKPKTAFCEFEDEISEQPMADADDEQKVRGSGAEGPDSNGDPKANSGHQESKERWRSSAIPSSATTTLPYSPSSSSLGPENQSLFKSTSPFSPMQTHSRSQLSLQLSATRPAPEAMDSPTLVVIDPSVEAILNERRPRSPSAPDTPTNSLSQRGTPVGSSDAIRVAHMRQIQKQRTRENFLFGTSEAEVDIAGEETPKAETASPDYDDVASGAQALETLKRSVEGAATATASDPSPITPSGSSSSLLSRIVRPRIRLSTITSTAHPLMRHSLAMEGIAAAATPVSAGEDSGSGSTVSSSKQQRQADPSQVGLPAPSSNLSRQGSRSCPSSPSLQQRNANAKQLILAARPASAVKAVVKRKC